MIRFVLVAAICTAGCQVPTDTDPLTRLDGWTMVDSHPELWPTSPTPASVCDAAMGQRDVGGVIRLEVDMTHCHRLTLMQPSGHDLGETIELDFYHSLSTVPDVGDARVMVAVGDTLIFDADEPIFASAGAITESIEIMSDIPQGTPIRVHIQDPGDTEWLLMYMGRSEDRPETDAPTNPRAVRRGR